MIVLGLGVALCVTNLLGGESPFLLPLHYLSIICYLLVGWLRHAGRAVAVGWWKRNA